MEGALSIKKEWMMTWQMKKKGWVGKGGSTNTALISNKKSLSKERRVIKTRGNKERRNRRFGRSVFGNHKRTEHARNLN